jgi:hypothetical protein
MLREVFATRLGTTSRFEQRCHLCRYKGSIDEQGVKERILSAAAKIREDTKALRQAKLLAAINELGDWMQIEDIDRPR